MAQARIWFSASHEQFPPSECLRQALHASQAGFDGIGCSDHFQPWWPDGQSGQAWVWLGAAGQAIERLPIGTGVTPVVHHYHPGLVAQAFMSLEEMFPGRVFLGVGSGEALNEVPLGMDWPPVGEQIRRMEQALEAITRLWDGETVTMDAGWFRLKEAKLYTHAPTRPKIYVSAFGPRAARVAARWSDGVWTLGNPEKAPPVLDAYRAACEEYGREPGEMILHGGIAWAQTEEQAVDGARVWRGALPPEFYVDDWHDPAAMQEEAAKRYDDDGLRKGQIVSADPDHHVERVRQLQDMGATIVCLQNMSGADPMGTIDVYRDRVLPQLRGAPAA
jgi:coenzyme F420-dependent glucose-6-phosphate dehydrogenase